MAEMKEHPPGTFCWVDLATTDAEVGKKFYTDLFGWQSADMPAGEGVYTMFSKDGKSVCALYSMNDEMRKQGVPPHWQSYVSVESADESAKKAKDLGGTLTMPPFDVMDVGRMAVVRDPTGAMFALWQPKLHIGAQLVNEPGTLCWNELDTKDVEAAAKFYAGLFGWTTKTIPGAMAQEYTEFYQGDKPAGGMIQIQDDWGPVPPHWAAYFAVEDCEASFEKAKGLGAKVFVPPTDIKDVGQFAVLEDPQGAHFAVIQLLEGAA